MSACIRHIVTAWYVRELNDTPYLFLEYCEGGDLADWIDQGKTRNLKVALDIAIQLAWGLAHCHEKGIVHRDFKPQNVMMTAEGTAKITDFGMVKFAAIERDDDESAETDSNDIRQTLGGGIRGTPPLHVSRAVDSGWPDRSPSRSLRVRCDHL